MTTKSLIKGMIICLVVCILLFVQVFAQEEEKPNPKLTEVWEPVPPAVTPGDKATPPSDAIILFDGTDFSNWVNSKGETPKWKIENGAMTAVKKTGAVFTKQKFGDCQLHIEFRTPAEIKGKGQGRGNSGIFLQNRYELQVLDSYDNKTYSNGQCGSIYKQYIPLVNVCRKPGEWQAYDIIYMAPRFNKDGIFIAAARITVFQNGVLIQNNVEIKGNTEHRGLPSYKQHGKAPIQLQDHGNPVSYRNIWIREL